ncbi:DUF3422 family protein [Fulvimarina sp. 2208YS6-2-32]|uniref:DUF3422 family protein n=1 Tax=Fulvimarina uroteuthidis TaxID=3098149 RepID=A0ABU5HZV5_9HYPH|nr:DUF3422 family protein [Fulvimarina sp. 2208YS6-2-32]MDY8108590.1 DUF3422 family protein [Fulvimarina sp. 2208YS6-2-32]
MTDRTLRQMGRDRFPTDPRRATVLGEIHARPFPLITLPRAVITIAFMTQDGGLKDRATLGELSRRQGVPPPSADARTHSLVFGRGRLRWESHTEFSTYTWDGPTPERFGNQVEGHPFGAEFTPPGPMIAGVHLEIRPKDEDTEKGLAIFDKTSLCYSEMEGGLAFAATDFRQDSDGLTRMLILSNGLTQARAGALAMRLVDLEVYRTLALLGLPLAQDIAPTVQGLEEHLVHITNEMKGGAEESRELLQELTLAAAEVEAAAARVLYRFGASRAYDDIVRERLSAVGEQPVPGSESWNAFLQRRMAPAMRTCLSIDRRLAVLSEKLSRAADLLRTRIDVELEHQNRDLLTSMDKRARLQLRLQQTVEGLSVAAIAYYVVGLFGYVAKAVEAEGFPVSATILTAAFVPIALVGVWSVVHRIRTSHRD